MTDPVHDPAGQALVSDGAATHLHPSGFDPSRVRRCTSRHNIRHVANRFAGHYRDRENAAAWKPGWTRGMIADALAKLDPETATVDDVAEYVNRGWVTEDCDLCGREVQEWFQVGDEPDYEARWLDLCGDCIGYLPAIATEARRAETLGSVHEGADPEGIAHD